MNADRSDFPGDADDLRIGCLVAEPLPDWILSRKELPRDGFADDRNRASASVMFIKLPPGNQRDTDPGKIAGTDPIAVIRIIAFTAFERERADARTTGHKSASRDTCGNNSRNGADRGRK